MAIASFYTLLARALSHNVACVTCMVPDELAAISEYNVYTDGVHLTSWSVESLHSLAQRIGHHRTWFQEEGLRFRGRGSIVSHDHYDLTTVGAYHRARNAGAIFLPMREHARAFPAYRKRRGLSIAGALPESIA